VPSRFEQINHTADLAIRVWGRNLRELFQNAALGMFSFLADTEGRAGTEDHVVEATADNCEELLVSWLRKLLFLHQTELLVPTGIDIETISEQNIRARVSCLRVEEGDPRIFGEIKAVTYHGLEINETEDGLVAQIVFDT